MREWAWTIVGILGCASNCPTPSSPTPLSAIGGQVYVDNNGSDRSRAIAGYDWRDRALAGVRIDCFGHRLHLAAYTCDNGRYALNRLPAGDYFLAIDQRRTQPHSRDALTSRSSSKNHAPHLAAKIRASRAFVMATIGDSFPVGTPTFDEFAARHFRAAGIETTTLNLAVGGTTTHNWLPGTRSFERLSQQLPRTDVLVVSLGGNDLFAGLYEAFQRRMPRRDPQSFRDFRRGIHAATEALNEFPRELVAIRGRLRIIDSSIHEINPEVEIVHVLYPNMLRSRHWRGPGGPAVDLALPLIEEVLNEMRRAAAREDILLLDLAARFSSLDLDEYARDGLHLNELGHAVAGQELFRTLGGVTTHGGELADYSVGFVRVATPSLAGDGHR